MSITDKQFLFNNNQLTLKQLNMEKKFSKIEIAVIKRTAQNVSQFVTKKEKMNAEIEKIKASKQEMIDKYAATLDEKIAAKVAKVQAEIDTLQPIIDSFQGPIKEMTGGYTTEDLITREVVHTGKMDANTGKELLQTRFVLKYPDTVIPVAAEEDKAEAVPTTAEGSSSDMDAEEDAEWQDRIESGELEEAPVNEEMAYEKSEGVMVNEPDPFTSPWD